MVKTDILLRNIYVLKYYYQKRKIIKLTHGYFFRLRLNLQIYRKNGYSKAKVRYVKIDRKADNSAL